MSFEHDSFEAFSAIGAKHGLFDPDAGTPEHWAEKIRQWGADFILSRHELPGHTWDRVLILQPVFRGERPEEMGPDQSPTEAIIFCVNSITQRANIFMRKHGGDQFDFLKSAANVEAIIRDMEKHGWGHGNWASVASFNADKDRLDWEIRSVSGFGRLKQQIDLALAQADEKLAWHLTGLDNKEALRGEMADWLAQRVQSQAKAFISLLDAKAMECAENYRGAYHERVTNVYNHIVAASGLSREFRIGALAALHHAAFLDSGDLWSDIDAGVPAYKALGKSLKVEPSAAKRIARNGGALTKLFSTYDILKQAPLLEVLDHSKWPQTPKEARHFNLMNDYVDEFSKAMGLRPQDAMRELAKELDNDPLYRWQKLFGRRLYRHKRLVPKRWKIRTPNAEMRFNGDVMEKFRVEMNGVSDMKGDVLNRIIKPLVLLGLEKRGWEVADLESIRSIAYELEEKFWAGSPPSEKRRASDYWHSPRVEFHNRFASIAVAKTDARWKTLIDEPYGDIAIDGKQVVFEPLNSNEALVIEGGEMHHCVGTYTIKCLSWKYHIFSIRDEEGKRASTFTCYDITDEDGKTELRHIENLSYQNTKPPAWAERAAEEFMHRVNTGILEVDWEAIRQSKREALTDEMFITVGYDFRDDAKSHLVYKLYQPLIPRAITGDARNNHAALAQHLGVPQAVDEFIKKWSSHFKNWSIYPIVSDAPQTIFSVGQPPAPI